MTDFNKRTAIDMINDYRSGIADIDRKIEALRSEGSNLTPATLKYIYSLEDSRCDMVRAVNMIRQYNNDDRSNENEQANK